MTDKLLNTRHKMHFPNAELPNTYKIEVSDSPIQTAPSIVRLCSKALAFFVEQYMLLDTVA